LTRGAVAKTRHSGHYACADPRALSMAKGPGVEPIETLPLPDDPVLASWARP